MKFYMTPGSCSTGIHILLEELQLVFQAHIVDILNPKNLKPDFLAVNPRGSIPTLVTDDALVLTDYRSIALWLAHTYPKQNLLPRGAAAQARALEVLDYVLQHVHGQGFTRIFLTERYAATADEQSAILREGRAAVERGFAHVERLLSGDTYASETFSIADSALFYVEFWADRIGIPLSSRLHKHYSCMLDRPAVRQVLGEEGYASTLRKHAIFAARAGGVSTRST